MLAMRPIDEPDVLQLLNDGRFEGDVEGYVIMDGAQYLGHALFTVAGDEVVMLDTGVEDSAVLDGVVRACLAAGENRGACRFTVNQKHPPLAHWWQVFCTGKTEPVPIRSLWGECE